MEKTIVEYQRVPAYARFFFYGLSGFATEVVFTCCHDIANGIGSWDLKGYSSIWSFFIYALGTITMEYFYTFLKGRGTARFFRGLVYVLSAFFFEFGCGIILRQFDACSWDYSHTPYHFMGLIRLDYAPFWFSGGLALEIYYSYFEVLRIPVIAKEKAE